ncbi:DUF3566 domain-containing protein [Sinomonas sp.]|uniref:DUF3566 domain-containing protein n=1 Tax=Sinomonas sp. TaxID=1914986 RepID=UPI002CCFCC55|nr:DUF3566 domain-containing protein [Sinomonas sp.]
MSTPENEARPGGYPQVTPPARPPQRPAVSPSSAAGYQPRGTQAPTTSGAPRPAAAAPGSAQRPAGARPAQRPPLGGAPTQGLVRPAPKAKQRRARLLVSKVDPWSVLKMAFLLSVALGIVTVVASIVLWMVLDVTGIFDKINGLLGQVAGSESGGFDLKKVASLGQVASFATIIAVVNVVLLTALSMLAAVLYNIASALVGGVGVTLTDD